MQSSEDKHPTWLRFSVQFMGWIALGTTEHHMSRNNILQNVTRSVNGNLQPAVQLY